MSKILPRSVQKLIDEFSKLPGVGPKTASRLAFYLLTKPNSDIENLGEAVSNLKKNLVYCQECFNIAEKSPCDICVDPKRDKTKLMVVEEPLDVVALSKTNYNGLYHVLGGVISPIDGIGPEQLRVRELLAKLKKEALPAGGIKEVILATDPSLEGEATSMYIAKQIEKISAQGGSAQGGKIKVTRIARGLPVGGDLEYADEITLSRALEGRGDY